ncbi:MAG: hypothetical protein ABIS45_06940 [Burkholderiales bacterium]
MVMLAGDTRVPLNCVVGNFKAVDRDFKVEAVVIDTPKVNITGNGNANFADESLRMRLVSQQQGFSLVSLRGPMVITGTFQNPLIRPEQGRAVALGAVTAEFGTLIPLLDFGKKKNGNCAARMAQAKSDAGVKASDMAPRVGRK